MPRRFASLSLLLALSAVAAAQIPGANPAAGPIEPFQANPDYLLTAKQGPFMIYICSFRGDSAGPLAQDLVKELRETHRMPAYLLRRVDEEAAAERDRIRAEQLQRYGDGVKNLRKVRVLEDWAVLVGNYGDLKTAADDLKRIKQVEKPRNLPIFTKLQAWTNPLAEQAQTGKVKDAEKLADYKAETFRQAFATRNPLAPKPAMAKQETPQNLAVLNEYEKFSLLKNRAPYTLVVMEFRSPTEVSDDKSSVFDQKAFAGSRSQYGPDKRFLEHAVLLAQRLTEQLRDQGKGYEAYLLHTSRSTIVTVGGFKSADDPALQKARETLAGQNVGGVQLLKQPYTCQVPRS